MEEYLNNMNKLMEQSINFTQNINQEMEKGITQMYYIGAMETIISIIITIAMIYYNKRKYKTQNLFWLK